MPTRRKRPRAVPKRRWRDYETPAGHRPVKAFLDRLGDLDVAAIVAALREVEQSGLATAKHLRGEIYEVIADGDRQTFRILFAPEGRHKQVLLALDGFSKKTQKTPPERLRLAERRLADWRMRGRRL
jgi:phage-related protein